MKPSFESRGSVPTSLGRLCIGVLVVIMLLNAILLKTSKMNVASHVASGVVASIRIGVNGVSRPSSKRSSREAASSASAAHADSRDTLMLSGHFPSKEPMTWESYPSVIIAGVAKGGTTDLYDSLTKQVRYPDIVRGIRKETNALVNLPDKERYKDMLLNGSAPGPGVYTIDATPMYIHNPFVVDNVMAVAPRAKVVVLLRNEVQRAVSLYDHWVSESLMRRERTFDSICGEFFGIVERNERLKRILEEIKGLDHTNTSTWGAMSRLYRDMFNAGGFNREAMSIFSAGLYKYQLVNWAARGNPRNMLVLSSPAYYASRAEVIEALLEFLMHAQNGDGDDDEKQKELMSDSQFERLNAAEVTTVRRRKKPTVPSKECLDRMERFYRTHNKGLESLLSSDPSSGATLAHFGFRFGCGEQSDFYFG